MGMFEENLTLPILTEIVLALLRATRKKSRIMARENDCGRRERFWLARTILSRENDPSSGERLWSRERLWSEPGLRRSSSSTIPQAKGVILKTFAGSSGLYSMQAVLGRVARWVGGDQPAHNTNDQRQ